MEVVVARVVEKGDACEETCATMLVLAIGEEVLARVLMQREFVRRSGLAVALPHPLVLQW